MGVTDTEGTTDKRHTNLAPSRSGWSKPAPNQRISFGTPISRALPEAVEMLSAHHVVVVTTRSLAGPDGLAEAVRRSAGLGWHFHDKWHSSPHASRGCDSSNARTVACGWCRDDWRWFRSAMPLKRPGFCLANGVTEAAEMDRLCSHRASDGVALPVISPSLPFIAIPDNIVGSRIHVARRCNG